MKLYPFMTVNSVPRNIIRISRRLNINVLVSKVDRLKCFIVIGDGTPEDKILAVIAHHLNDSDKVAGVAKPEFTGIKVFELVPKYLGQHVNSILILIDQESFNIDELIAEIENKLRSYGITVENKSSENRLSTFDCKRGGRKFKLIVIINGLDEIPFEEHMIEDHLLKATKILLGEKIDSILSNCKNAKEVWKKLSQHHEEIYRRILSDKKLLEDAFPQQVKAMKILEESC